MIRKTCEMCGRVVVQEIFAIHSDRLYCLGSTTNPHLKHEMTFSGGEGPDAPPVEEKKPGRPGE